MTDNDDDAGGYGKPPKKHVFKPGHPRFGGRKARPKVGTTSNDSILDQTFEITLAGKRKRVTMADFVLAKQFEIAAGGDTSAAALIIKTDRDRRSKAVIGSPSLPQRPPTIVFSTFNQSAFADLGVLTGPDPQHGRKLATWAARAALERVTDDFWDQPEIAKRAIYIQDPMALLDLVPDQHREQWAFWSTSEDDQSRSAQLAST